MQLHHTYSYHSKLINKSNANFRYHLILFAFVLISSTIAAQVKIEPTIKGDSIIYDLNISKQSITIKGKDKQSILVNGSLPAPTLVFTEGKIAVINVTNNMDVESSVHWHGLLLPNIQDGVPYLTTPPILPKSTYRYEFPLIHSGTYWYHSHTNLQEQEGVYGAIVIQPTKKEIAYDKEYVIVLSDWTKEKATTVMKNLKRHLEWYSIKRNTPQPLLNSIGKGLFKERWILYRNRMPDMHIADVYYDAFLSNGEPIKENPYFLPNEKVRLRVVNAAASTYFWLNATTPFEVISADGIDVQPIKKDSILMAIAETYDFIVQIPENGKFHFQASAQDGSGSTSVHLGQGDLQKAKKIAPPDYYELMDKVAQLHKKGGHSGHLLQPYVKILPPEHQMHKEPTHGKHMKNNNDEMNDNQHQEHQTHQEPTHDNHMENNNEEINDDQHDGHQMHQKNSHNEPELKNGKDVEMNHGPHHEMKAPNVTSSFTYDFLKAKEVTTIRKHQNTREIMMNLNANMLRYVWMINGKVLSKEDKIKINKGETVRIIMNNNTMMHHPMHLHGHFFRVINQNGDYSPLKHTVDVPPFESMTIEFDANEQGDWFFHCHVLYHMMAGMARIFSYDTPRDEALAPYPYHKVLHHDKQYFHWSTINVSSNMASIEYVASNTFNAFVTNTSYGWNKNGEFDLRYERFINRFTRVVGGLNAENEIEDSFDNIEFSAFLGIRNQLLSILDVGVNIDHRIRPELELEWHIGLLKAVQLVGHYEWQNDFNISNTSEVNSSYEAEHTVSVGLEYIISRHIAISANYDNRYGAGVGFVYR